MPVSVTRRLYPLSTKEQHPTATYNVHIVSEGYMPGSNGQTAEQLFFRDAKRLVANLFKLSPFSMLFKYGKSFQIHGHFIVNMQVNPQPGPRITSLNNDYSSANPTTTLDSVFHSGQNKLYINKGGVDNLATYLSVKHETLTASVGDTVNSSTNANFLGLGVIFILLPEQTGLGTSNPLVEMESLPDPNTNPYLHYFVASSANAKCENVLARGIARSLGLADEFSLPGGGFPSLAADINRIEKRYKNLIYLPATPVNNVWIPPLIHKWNEFLDGQQRSNGIPVYGNPPATIPIKIGLHPGGAGFETKVYRSSLDCIMRRNYSDGNAPIKSNNLSFCPICSEVIRQVITGRSTAELPLLKGLSDQRLVYDEVNWLNEMLQPSATVASTSVSTPPSDNPSEYWTFSYQVGTAVGGLKLTNVKNWVYPTPLSALSGRPAVDHILFKDIKVVFTDNTELSFSISNAYSNGKAAFRMADGSRANSVDNFFQRGYKLEMTDNVGGFCNVTVDLSVVFRGKVHDFDPGGVAAGMKVFPQISFKWHKGGTKKVKEFKGIIEMDVIVEDDFDDSQNFAGYFLDSNEFIKIRKYNLPPRPFDWALNFDAYFPNAVANINQTKSVVGVYGPDNQPKWAHKRIGIFTHAATYFGCVKNARQGAYDNLHIHGKSGYVLDTFFPDGNDLNDYPDFPPGTKLDGVPYLSSQNNIVEAPFCPHNCFHLHWRWGPQAIAPAGLSLFNYKDIAPPPFRKYIGWSRFPAYANSLPGAPLIPPNQELIVDVTNVTPKTKRVEYQIRVIDPSVDENQVLMEQGCAFASGTPFMNEEIINEQYGPPNLDDNNCHSIHHVYDKIRFFSVQNGDYVTQIPVGVVGGVVAAPISRSPTNIPTTFEDL